MNKELNRRNFLKYLGGGIVASSALLTACKDDERRTTAALQEPPKDKMTYRTNPNTGDKVSLLGYGMMRLPVVSGSGQDNQDAPCSHFCNTSMRPASDRRSITIGLYL